MTSIVPNKNFSKNSSSNQRAENIVNYYGNDYTIKSNVDQGGIDYAIIDELNEFRKLGFNTFEGVNNLTDLVIDQENSLFAYSAALSDLTSLLIGIRTNFGNIVPEIQHIPIAVEEIRDPELNTEDNIGSFMLITKTINPFSSWTAPNELFAFLFDSNGYWYQTLGMPVSNKGINDVENFLDLILIKMVSREVWMFL